MNLVVLGATGVLAFDRLLDGRFVFATVYAFIALLALRSSYLAH